MCKAETQDIFSFLQSTLSRLAPEPLEATIEDTREPLPYKKYRVKYRSLGGIRVRAFLSVPIRAAQSRRALPAIVSVPGYGGLQQGINA
jgi:cephalosporin-C deacetylase-like acetyl esterase